MRKWVGATLSAFACALLARASYGQAVDDEPAGKLAVEYVLRPVVLPSMVWAFEGTSQTTLQPGGTLQVVGLGTRFGSPLFWSGLELAATPALVLAPPTEAVAPVGSVTITQRLFPWQSNSVHQLAVQPVSNQPLEVAARLSGGRDPGSLDFFGQMEAPIALRAARFLRIDVDPLVGFLGAGKQGFFATDVLASVQPARVFWIGVRSGVRVPQLSKASVAVPLGGELGVTVPTSIGPLLDVVLDGTFPQLFQSGGDTQSPDTRVFQAFVTVRVFTYWALCAANPVACAKPDDPARVKRCGDAP
jgi:hypothetical protein